MTLLTEMITVSSYNARINHINGRDSSWHHIYDISVDTAICSFIIWKYSTTLGHVLPRLIHEDHESGYTMEKNQYWIQCMQLLEMAALSLPPEIMAQN